MVANPSAFLIGGVAGILVAGLVNAWEERLVMRHKGWIASVSIIGALGVACIVAYALGSTGYRHDSLLQVLLAALLAFVPLRRLKILKSIFLGGGTKVKAPDGQNED
jgi:hypothetical protein